ncbi:unnamed protein product [Arabis nemorensis]|uniref:DUF577 domain-containing protein n=1 Tax=Arabis nemorensis TaxID=586526 RepID=A0A565C619_9BRAS|nr:unnamed protein product [Arabis nemorensis]
MAESSNLMMKARDLLATPSHQRLSIIIDQLFTHQDSDEYQTARALYGFCVANFPNCLTLMLLNVYRSSSSDDDLIRFRSILLLSESLTELRNHRRFILSLVALNDIKPLLISCLTMPQATKSDTEILRRIVSCVAFSVVILNNGGWDELGDCILSLTHTDPLRAFNVFLDLPQFNGGFINRFLWNLVEEVYKVLANPGDRIEEWSLGLETGIKLGIQNLDPELSYLNRNILGVVLKSANELVKKGKERFLERGLERLVKFLAKDSILCNWSSDQCGFVAEFASRIAGIGTHTKEAARQIYQVVKKLDKYDNNPAFKLSPSLIEIQGADLDVYNNLKVLPAVEMIRLVAGSEMDDKSREIAVRRVHDLLCDHTLEKAEINVSEMRQLKRLLISCLTEVGVPENTFKILGQVVFHVANEMFGYQEDTWPELWDFIASGCETEFKKTVYIFQCLTMMLEDKRYVIRAIEKLLPEISRRLNPPRDLLVDNSYWVLAFVGGFCAAIHLLDVADHADSVDKIVCKMIDSVRELVEREMEVGVVRRAFRDMEIIVKKQCDWYDTREYRFAKALLWKLYEIKGMKMESRIVLWRINVILEKGTQNVHKELPKSVRQHNLIR